MIAIANHQLIGSGDTKNVCHFIDMSVVLRTSDSLNEGLPIKMTREKFQRKRYFFSEKR